MFLKGHQFLNYMFSCTQTLTFHVAKYNYTCSTFKVQIIEYFRKGINTKKVILFNTKIFLWLLISVLDFRLEPERPNNVYYSLRGSSFVVNCTIALGNVQPLNLTWQHNGKRLDHELELLDSSTVQLKLSNTSRLNNGLYWCGPKLGNTSRGINISLTVAGNWNNSFA